MINNDSQRFRNGFEIVAVVILCDMIGGTFGTLPILGAAFLVALLGQLGLIAIWGVFGPGRWFLRWPAVTLLAQVAILAFFAPRCIWSRNTGATREMLAGTLATPCFLLAAQLPLYAMKALRGYRIVPVHAPLENSGVCRGQFGISDILGATTLLAVVLALSETGRTMATEPLSIEFWGGVLEICLILIIVSILILLPCLWAIMRAKDQSRAATIVGGTIIFGPCLILLLLSRHPSPEIFVYPVFYGGPLVATVLGGLGLLRMAGFVMIRPGETLPVAVNEVDAPKAETDAATPFATTAATIPSEETADDRIGDA